MAIEETYRPEDWRVARMPLSTRTVPPDCRCGDAYAILAADAELPGLAVVDAKGIHGLIDRQSILTRFARPIMRDVYEGRAVTRLMDRRLLLDGPFKLVIEQEIALFDPHVLRAPNHTIMDDSNSGR